MCVFCCGVWFAVVVVRCLCLFVVYVLVVVSCSCLLCWACYFLCFVWCWLLSAVVCNALLVVRLLCVFA